jgi:hypothetical protein
VVHSIEEENYSLESLKPWAGNLKTGTAFPNFPSPKTKYIFAMKNIFFKKS